MVMMSEGSQKKSLFRRALRRLGNNEGTALVEYGVSITLFMTFLFGIMDFSRFIYTYHFVSEAAREATRYAMVRGATFKGTACSATQPYACNATGANITTFVQNLTPSGITSGSVTATTTWPSTAPTGAATACPSGNSGQNPGCLVEVEVSYPFKFMLPFLPRSVTTYTLSSTSEMVISR